MPVKIDPRLTPQKLEPSLKRLFDISAEKILLLQKHWNAAKGSPVFTVNGQYTSKGWTEWTQGFQFGSAILQYDATGVEQFLDWGRAMTQRYMAAHVSHFGVHDHGFNNISTYGNLLRLMREENISFNEPEREGYELALKVSGAVQAARWTPLDEAAGYIYSFNGPHSLFIDTMRSLRSLAVAHQLGHRFMGEQDRKESLLHRLVAHGLTTARYAIYYGEGRDAYDIRGRTAHESIFNVKNGSYRCPNSQQGYSPFSTWTRGLAWAMTGFAEQLEYLKTLPERDFPATARRVTVIKTFLKAAQATADFYLESTPRCGVPYWDTGAPQLHRIKDYGNQLADPFNPWEPVDSSAAAIAAQGLYRLGRYLKAEREEQKGQHYCQAGLTIARTLLDEPYLSIHPRHHGLLLHSVYHRPNGWDHIASGQSVPNGESSMWGDYHLRELALLLWREAQNGTYLTFFAHHL